MKYQLTIEPNQGYAPDQTRTITVRDLQELLADLEPDTEIFTLDYQNSYGAKYGGLTMEVEEIQ